MYNALCKLTWLLLTDTGHWDNCACCWILWLNNISVIGQVWNAKFKDIQSLIFDKSYEFMISVAVYSIVIWVCWFSVLVWLCHWVSRNKPSIHRYHINQWVTSFKSHPIDFNVTLADTISHLTPISEFLDHNTSFDSQMAMQLCRKLQRAKNGCPIVFQVIHPMSQIVHFLSA